MLPLLSAGNRDAAVAFARVPEQIRGFGHVKARHLQAARRSGRCCWSEFYRQTPTVKRDPGCTRALRR